MDDGIHFSRRAFLKAGAGFTAGAHDVIVVIEPFNTKETNFINTLPEGARLVEPVDHPTIRLLADIHDTMRMDEPPAVVGAMRERMDGLE